MRLVPAHRISNLEIFERPVYEAFLRAALRPRIDGGIAVAAEAGGRVPDCGCGWVEGVEGPVPVANEYILVDWTDDQDIGSLRHWSGVTTVAEGALVHVDEEPVPGEKYGHRVDCGFER